MTSGNGSEDRTPVATAAGVFLWAQAAFGGNGMKAEVRRT